jgi:hypothetical protein
MGRWPPQGIRPQAAQTHGVGADGVLARGLGLGLRLVVAWIVIGGVWKR